MKNLAKLTKKKITDKNGVSRYVWVKTGEEVKKPKTEKKEEVKKPNSQIKSLLEALKLTDNRYKDWTKITVNSTPKGNWRLYYDGKETSVTYDGNRLSEDTIREYNLENYD